MAPPPLALVAVSIENRRGDEHLSPLPARRGAVGGAPVGKGRRVDAHPQHRMAILLEAFLDRKSTRLNSSHANISYAVFCLNKKKTPGRASSSSFHREKAIGCST